MKRDEFLFFRLSGLEQSERFRKLDSVVSLFIYTSALQEKI
ncbi:MAG TPA: hypothetical protein ACQGQH_01090 [Xylella sp.]